MAKKTNVKQELEKVQLLIAFLKAAIKSGLTMKEALAIYLAGL